MNALQTRYNAAIDTAIVRARETQGRVTVKGPDSSEVYAYPHSRGIAWGVNAAGTGVNILRGVRRSDGTDEAVS